jgi:hypothetical protein
MTIRLLFVNLKTTTTITSSLAGQTREASASFYALAWPTSYGAGFAALTVGAGTGVTDGAEFGAIGATAGTGVAETAGTLFIIGAELGTGTTGKVSLSGRLRPTGVGLVVGTVVFAVWPIGLVCAEADDSVITHDTTIAK